MLVIDPDDFGRLCEHLMVASRTVKDTTGLRVMADTPQISPEQLAALPASGDSDVNAIRCFMDIKRIRAIALGAIVAMVNGPAYVGDEVQLGDFLKRGQR